MKEPKIGQLCWFWRGHIENGNKPEVGVVTYIHPNGYEKDHFPYRHTYCQPLTKQEIQQFMEKANEPTRL